jgi:YD repeat-containing protein
LVCRGSAAGLTNSGYPEPTCYHGQLVAATDALGQVTTLVYEHPTEPLTITAVEDPFGRRATFQYNAAGQLAAITDTLGLTSSFLYGPEDFIEQMTTPYGTTTFRHEPVEGEAVHRLIEATASTGATERLVFSLTSPDVPVQEAAAQTGLGDDHEVDVGAGDARLGELRDSAGPLGEPAAPGMRIRGSQCRRSGRRSSGRCGSAAGSDACWDDRTSQITELTYQERPRDATAGSRFWSASRSSRAPRPTERCTADRRVELEHALSVAKLACRIAHAFFLGCHGSTRSRSGHTARTTASPSTSRA